MNILANRLMAQARSLSRDGITQMRGLDSQQTEYRIGLWPLLSDTSPETALGLMAALGYLLEQRRDVIVYRLFVSVDVDHDDDMYEWQLDDSQFSVDDWQLDDLDENIAIWGAVEHTGDQWALTLEIESDLAEEDDVIQLDYTAARLHELVDLLPRAALDILEKVIETPVRAPSEPVYTVGTASDAHYETFLQRVFRWERDLYLYLWDVDWEPAQIIADHKGLIDAAGTVDDAFAAWLAAHTTARAMEPVTDDIAQTLIEPAQSLAQTFADHIQPAVRISPTLFRLGKTDEAFKLLETTVQQHPTSTRARVALVDLYWRDSRIRDVLSLLQDSIETDVTNTAIYLRYAELLLALHRSMSTPPGFVLIDAADQQPDRTLEEAAAAYAVVYQDDPTYTYALQRQTSLYAELSHPDLWPTFERLVRADATGEYVRAALDSFEMLEDIEPAVRVLEAEAASQPDRHDVKVNLAVAYLENEQGDAALPLLEEADNMAEDAATIADIERLLLQANNSEFEFRLGEITDWLNAGKVARASDIDFLEDALEDAPTFAQGYLLLAQAYHSQNNDGAALEILLDGQKCVPDDGEVTAMLARDLWEAGEHQLALDYLNKGLAFNSSDVALLSLTGRYLYEEDQIDDARAYLARAESLNPRHRVLLETKRYIAETFANDEH